MRKQLCLLLFCLLALCVSSLAQGLGSIVGTVTDPSGAVLPGAKIIAVQVDTGLSRTTTADSQGYFVLSSLKPARYTISIESTGFRTSKQDVTLLADQTLTVNGHLQLGAPGQVIEVIDTQLEADTSTSTLKNVVEQIRLTELPLNGRNAATLTLTTAGSVQAPSSGADQGTTKTFPGAVTLSVNGARQNQISYQLDGGNYVDEYTNVNQPFPNPDALQEFSIQTSNYSAEYGQNAGAVVNVVTKSGTNTFHGDAFEFVRNAVFNARNWGALLSAPNGQPTKDEGRDQLKRNQFGGTIGGPIIKNRAFFFASYQGTRLRNLGLPSQTTVPSAVLRATATDPAVINLLKGIPIGDANNKISFAKPDHQDFHDLLGKVDYVLTANDRLSVRYAYDRFSKLAIFDPANFLTYTDGSTITSQNVLFHESHVFNPHLLSDARFSYSREKANRGPAANAINVADLGVNLPFQPIKAIQQIRVNNGFNFGDNPSASFVRNNFSWSDDVSWVMGRQDLHFGGTLERSRVDLNNKFFQPAEFSFDGFANLMAGKLTDYSGNPAFRQGAGEFKNNRNIFAGLYVQDNVRLNRRLTINLGLRWEPGLAWRELKNRWSQFRIPDLIAGVHSTVFPNAPAGLFFPADNGFPPNGLRSSLNNFAPRLGFAWDVFGDSKTSLRGGAGIFYDTRQSGMNNNRFVDSTPFSPQLFLQTNISNPGTFSDPLCTQSATQALQNCMNQTSNYPFPATFPPPKNARFRPSDLYLSWDPNHKWQVPTVYNWNLVVERQLPAGFLARTGYVGSRTGHLGETINQDPCQPSATAICTGALRRLNMLKPPTDVLFGDLQVVPYDINSGYHSLQLSTERRGKILTFTSSYTWSKSVDDLPPGQGLYGFDGTYSARPWDDPLRHAFDNGPSEFDHQHRFISSFVYQLPSLEAGNGFLRNTLGGWQFSGLVSAQTGRPLTPLSGANSNSGGSHAGLGQDRPNLVGNPYGAGACSATSTVACRDWLNPAAFVVNPAGTFGNVGKGSLRYPGYYDWDMGLGKNFQFTERVGLQFRAEFFNIFNRVNFDECAITGGTSITGASCNNNFLKLSSKGNFGALRTALDPRIGQLGLKLTF